jgi:hypothetical protein
VCQFIAFTPDQVARDIEIFAGNCGQYVFISSASVYEKPARHYLITEQTPAIDPFWRYSQDKIACEAMGAIGGDVENLVQRGQRPWRMTIAGHDGWLAVQHAPRHNVAVAHHDGQACPHGVTGTDDGPGKILGILQQRREINRALRSPDCWV